MHRVLPVAFCLVFAASATEAFAQPPAAGGRPAAGAPLPVANGEVRGTVLDSRGDLPVARASVAVRLKRDSSLVAGAMATEKGTFRIQGLRPGAYYLRVTSIGFAPQFHDFTITNEALVANAGTLRLTPVAVELTGITVTEERDAVTVEPDRNAYRAKDVAPAATNASDVLDAVPAVQVDGDGKVSLRGNENVAVQINGRPSPIRGTQLGAYLKGLPANVVERVEVIPNPSAKYDPEGMAGIINIVLKQNTDLGVSAGLTASVSTTDRYNASGNLGYQSGPITTFSNVGFNTDTRAVVGINDRERYDALNALTSMTNQDVSSAPRFNGQRFMTSVDYRLNARDAFFNQLSINRRTNGEHAVVAYSELNASGDLLDEYLRPRDVDARGLMFDYTTSLKRTFAPRKHELNTELRVVRSRDEDVTSIWRAPLTGVTQTERQRDDLDSRTTTLNAQLDYMRPLGTEMKLETGYKNTTRLLDREFVVDKDDLGTDTWTRSNLSNDFQFDEYVNAAYGVLSKTIRKLDLQGGLRAEHASRDFSLSTGSYPYSYVSLFPSGVLSYNRSAATQMKVSYSRRIRRPGTQELNPFPSFFDVQNVFIGNPQLSPEYTDAIELGYTRNMSKGMVQVSPFYRHTTDIIRVDIDPEAVVDGREVTTISFRNLATSDSWGADLNGQLRLGQKLTGFAGFNVFKMVTDGGSVSSLGSDAVTWMGRVNATTNISKTLMLQGSYFYRAPMKIEKGRFDQMQMANISVRQKLVGDRATMTLRINDPFNTGGMRIRAGDGNVVQITERNFGSRMAFLTFQYNYGQAPRVREPRAEPQQEPQARFP